MIMVVRGLFAGVLILGLAAQAARTAKTANVGATNGGAASASTGDLTAALRRLDGRVVATTPSGAVTAVLSRCSDPVTIAQIGFDGSGDGLLDRAAQSEATQLYAYLGFVGDRLDVTAIAGRWVTASALQAIGLRRDNTPAKVVLVLLPKTCPEAADLDWSILSPWS
jgi:hypothetical protein